jgi:hypothetical protein
VPISPRGVGVERGQIVDIDMAALDQLSGGRVARGGIQRVLTVIWLILIPAPRIAAANLPQRQAAVFHPAHLPDRPVVPGQR